jgi:hypothetical protein
MAAAKMRAVRQPRSEQDVIREASRAAAAGKVQTGLPPRCEQGGSREASSAAAER